MTDINVLKYKIALKGFAKLFNDAKQKEKHAYLYPIRRAGIPIKQAKELGFKVSFRLWQTCLNQTKRSKGKVLQ